MTEIKLLLDAKEANRLGSLLYYENVLHCLNKFSAYRYRFYAPGLRTTGIRMPVFFDAGAAVATGLALASEADDTAGVPVVLGADVTAGVATALGAGDAPGLETSGSRFDFTVTGSSATIFPSPPTENP